MKFEVNKAKCAGCGACLRVCPHGAIKIGEDGKASIDQSKCKKCGTCQGICPFDAIEKIPEQIDEKNINQLKASSSPAPVTFPDGPLPSGGRGLGRGKGPGWSKGMGRKWRGGRS